MSSSNVQPKILTIGLVPHVSLPQYFRDLYGTPSNIAAKINKDMKLIKDAGYDTTIYSIDPTDQQTGLDWVEETLKKNRFHGVLLGSGLRVVPEYNVLFEKLVNIVMREAKGAVVMSSDGPGSNLDAIRRNEEELKG